MISLLALVRSILSSLIAKIFIKYQQSNEPRKCSVTWWHYTFTSWKIEPSYCNPPMFIPSVYKWSSKSWCMFLSSSLKYQDKMVSQLGVRTEEKITPMVWQNLLLQLWSRKWTKEVFLRVVINQNSAQC